jgi:signal transduction histidine kinase
VTLFASRWRQGIGVVGTLVWGGMCVCVASLVPGAGIVRLVLGIALMAAGGPWMWLRVPLLIIPRTLPLGVSMTLPPTTDPEMIGHQLLQALAQALAVPHLAVYWQQTSQWQLLAVEPAAAAVPAVLPTHAGVPQIQDTPWIYVLPLWVEQQVIAYVTLGARRGRRRYSSRAERRIRQVLQRHITSLFYLKLLADLRAEALQREIIVDMMRHELMQPLSGVIGYIDLLELQVRHDHSPAGLHQLIKQTVRYGHMLQLLFTTLFGWYRHGEAMVVERSMVNVSQLFQDIAAAVTAGNAGRIRIEGPDGLQVWTDEAKVLQITSNLLDNAIKYSPPGSPVTLTYGETVQTLFLTVADAGPGIPPDEREQIFQRFARLDRDRVRGVRGSGLGLTIVRALVMALGGTIQVADGPDGRGAVFRVEVPLVSRPAPLASNATPKL